MYDVLDLSDGKMDFLLAKEQCAVNILYVYFSFSHFHYEIALGEELIEKKGNEEEPLFVFIVANLFFAASVSVPTLVYILYFSFMYLTLFF